MSNTPHRPSRPVRLRPSGVIAPVDQDEVEKQLALRDVMEHAVRETRAVALAKPMQSYRSRPIVLGALMICTVLFTAYTFLAKPEFMYGLNPARVPHERREAFTRIAMYFMAQNVLAYRQQNGVLPATTALIQSWDSISYRALNDSVFELRAPIAGGPAVVLRSDQKFDQFVAPGLPLVRRRPE